MTASRSVGLRDDFFVWLAVEQGRSPATLEAYRRDIARFENWLSEQGTDVGAATSDQIARYVGHLDQSGLAAATVARALVAVRSLYRFAVVEGYLRDDPTVRLDVPRVPKGLPKALSETQIAALFDALDPDAALASRDAALLEVLYGTGARISEAVGLSLSDVDLEARLARLFGKGSRERIVPLGRPAVDALAHWFDERLDRARPARSSRDADAVFLNHRGGRLTRQGAWGVVSKYARRAGLADVMSPHVLRHSCATHMLEHGADIRTVQELLGHRSISTTQTYTRVAQEHLVSAYRAAHPRALGRAAAVAAP